MGQEKCYPFGARPEKADSEPRGKHPMKNEFNSIARVEQLAAERSLSVSRLAIDSGINPSTIATAKSRGCQLNLDTIIRICDHLELPLEDFLHREEHTEVIYSLLSTSTTLQKGGREHRDTGSRL